MKKFTKALLMLALAFFVSGAAFGIASLCAGFSMDEFVYMIEDGQLTIDNSAKWTEDIQRIVSDAVSPAGEFEWFYTDVESLKLEAGVADCTIIPYDGEEWKVYGYQLPASFRCKQNGKTLRISCGGRFWNLLGIGQEKAQLELYIPEDQIVHEMKIDAGVGAIRVDEGINEGVLKCESMDLDCGVGDTDISVDIQEKLKIDGGVGRIWLTLSGKLTDFNYDIDCGVGSIDIDGNHYAQLGDEYEIDNHAKKEIKIDCGVGSVEVYFSESNM